MKYYRKKYKGINILVKRKSDIFYIRYTMRVIDFVLSVDRKRFGYITSPKYILLCQGRPEHGPIIFLHRLLIIIPLDTFYDGNFQDIVDILVHESRHAWQTINHPKKIDDYIWSEADAYNEGVAFLKKINMGEGYIKRSIERAIKEIGSRRDRVVKRLKKVEGKDATQHILVGYNQTIENRRSQVKMYKTVFAKGVEFIDVDTKYTSA